MAVSEHHLGKGTIAYAGESAEYWAAKTAVLRRGRTRITLAIALVALVLGAWMISPWGPRIQDAQVTGSSRAASTSAAADSGDAAPGAAQVDVVLPGGARSSYSSTTSWPVGSTVTVSAFGNGRVVEGSGLVVSLWVITVLIGAVAAARGVWQYRNRHVVTTFR